MYIDEPTTVAGGGYKTRHPAILEQVEAIVNDGVSVMVIDPAKDNQLVGIRLAHTVER